MAARRLFWKNTVASLSDCVSAVEGDVAIVLLNKPLFYRCNAGSPHTWSNQENLVISDEDVVIGGPTRPILLADPDPLPTLEEWTRYTPGSPSALEGRYSIDGVTADTSWSISL